MQIFRPFESHTLTAQFLDDIRLNKQIVEAYQIALICFKKLELIPAIKMGYQNHPMVSFIFNNGKPYIPDLLTYITTLNNEWIARGFKRSESFYQNIDELLKILILHVDKFNYDTIPPCYIYGGINDLTSNAYQMYQDLLYEKWSKDKIKVKITMKKSKVDQTLDYVNAVKSTAIIT